MGILQARILKWVAMPSSRGSSQPRDQTQVSCIADGFFTIWATGEHRGNEVVLVTLCCCCSVTHGLQHTRPPYPLPSPGVCTSWCPLHQWCHLSISSSDALFTFCPQSFPASGSSPILLTLKTLPCTIRNSSQKVWPWHQGSGSN